MSDFFARNPVLKMKLEQQGIAFMDIEETFIRSSGPGGQNVNKVATCACLFYRPMGIKVKCQSERTQLMNRIKAWALLLEKITQKNQEAIARQIHLRERKRRQNRKRSAREKEEILQEKKKSSQIKEIRRKIKPHKIQDYI